MTSRISDYLYIFATIGLTVYGQLIFKWRIQKLAALPVDPVQKLKTLLWLVPDPAILSGFAAAFLAALSWMVVLTRMPLSQAYPLTALTFVLVVLGGGAIFNESIGAMQILGLVLIVLGLVIGSQ